MTFNEVLTGFDDILYTWLLIYMLAGAGIYFTVRSGFVQIRLLKEAFNCMFEKRQGDKGVSSFQALMIATASRVGTGNMAGVARHCLCHFPYYDICIRFQRDSGI